MFLVKSFGLQVPLSGACIKWSIIQLCSSVCYICVFFPWTHVVNDLLNYVVL